MAHAAGFLGCPGRRLKWDWDKKKMIINSGSRAQTEMKRAETGSDQIAEQMQ
jgi:hypothetical protein